MEERGEWKSKRQRIDGIVLFVILVIVVVDALVLFI